jgi:hypothetical protein
MKEKRYWKNKVENKLTIPHCEDEKSYKIKNAAASIDGISDTVAGSRVRCRFLRT